MRTLFHNKYRIETARYSNSDYNNGYFFVTFCTKNREHFLGEIIDNEMHLSEIGKYTLKTINETSIWHPYCSVVTYVIMPNHVHAIFYVAYKSTSDYNDKNVIDNDINVNQHMKDISHRKGKLSVAVGAIKSTVKRYANDNDLPLEWQSRFHDHIIRDANEFNHIANYIENNIFNWKSDCFGD